MLEGISPRPWEVFDYTNGAPGRETWLGIIRGAFEIIDERFQIGRVKFSALPLEENIANAKFIAAAPQIVDELLTLSAQQSEENARLREALEQWDTVGKFERMLDSKFPDANAAAPISPDATPSVDSHPAGEH